jgi:hypothetical protein
LIFEYYLSTYVVLAGFVELSIRQINQTSKKHS